MLIGGVGADRAWVTGDNLFGLLGHKDDHLRRSAGVFGELAQSSAVEGVEIHGAFVSLN